MIAIAARIVPRERQRWEYLQLCRAYNRAAARLPHSRKEFIRLAGSIHDAKAGAFIPRRWKTAAFIRKQGV